MSDDVTMTKFSSLEPEGSPVGRYVLGLIGRAQKCEAAILEAYTIAAHADDQWEAACDAIYDVLFPIGEPLALEQHSPANYRIWRC